MGRLIDAIFYIIIGLFVGVIFCKHLHADSYMSGMVGVFNTGKHSYSESKFLNAGYRQSWFLGLTYQLEIGGWTDVAGGGRKGSLYGAGLVGVETDGVVMGRAMAGPALLSQTDTYLGGKFPQFTEEVFFGVSGKNRNEVGFKYKHISSGGLYQPNMGRDYFGIEMSVPW